MHSLTSCSDLFTLTSPSTITTFTQSKRRHLSSRTIRRPRESKACLSRALDKLHIRTLEENGERCDNGHSHDRSAPSSVTALSSSNACQNDTAICKSSCEPTDEDYSLQQLSKRRKSLLPSISLTLVNSGSVGRDHLASERTFLAYVRTSLAIACSGVALVQLYTAASANPGHSTGHRLHAYIRPLGAVTIILGLIVLMIGVVRYFSVQAALTRGTFPVARAVTGFITMALTLLVIVMFGILLAGKSEPAKGKPRH
ncbi:putative protein with domain of unknown function (DUF202) [Lyophyllum shimeji]|uniref:DUF202 domain-containing protein n=1 Tax=Lyophyllum shimeji TaxID=47721 RepID=A0A9P3PN09_LYOSH|nr:putative protein with domain of unknown function (DUF202) [Lyophyllum shimeji]